MSGVFGVVGFGGGGVGGVLEGMGGVAAYRGPDGVGVWVDDELGVGLGCLELWVAPESVGETGPWVGEDLVVAADARLDNRAELIRVLGVEASLSDRALIAEAYRRWGGECVERLLGDFAFVVYDRKHRSVFAARDAMGMRPLYYRYENGRLWFASEVKQILAAPGVPARIFEPAVAGYLAGGVTRPEWSFYEDVHQLPPAHALTVDHNGPRVRRYWDIDPEHQIRYTTEADYAEHFRELFIEAVRCRVRTNYPVGIFLSGGVDSGSIASVIGWLQTQGEGPENFHAYTWAFDDLPQCDERHLSRLITNHYQIPTTDIHTDNAWPLANYPNHGPDPDEPFIWEFQPLIDKTLQTAQTNNTRIMLSGDRGDELVGDSVYDFIGLGRAKGWSAAARELAEWNEDVAGSSTGWAAGRQLLSMAKASAARVIGRSSLRDRVLEVVATRLPMPPWLPEQFAERTGIADIWAEQRVEEAFGFDPRRNRRERILMHAGHRIALLRNRRGAQNQTSATDPWSDRRLAEFVAAIPQWLVDKPTVPKRLAREAFAQIFPTIDKADKILPGPLYDLALRERARPIVEDLVSAPLAKGYGFIDVDGFREEFDRYLLGEQPRWDIWWPLTLEMWLRVSADGRGSF